MVVADRGGRGDGGGFTRWEGISVGGPGTAPRGARRAQSFLTRSRKGSGRRTREFPAGAEDGKKVLESSFWSRHRGVGSHGAPPAVPQPAAGPPPSRGELPSGPSTRAISMTDQPYMFDSVDNSPVNLDLGMTAKKPSTSGHKDHHSEEKSRQRRKKIIQQPFASMRNSAATSGKSIKQFFTRRGGKEKDSQADSDTPNSRVPPMRTARDSQRPTRGTKDSQPARTTRGPPPSRTGRDYQPSRTQWESEQPWTSSGDPQPQATLWQSRHPAQPTHKERRAAPLGIHLGRSMIPMRRKSSFNVEGPSRAGHSFSNDAPPRTNRSLHALDSRARGRGEGAPEMKNNRSFHAVESHARGAAEAALLASKHSRSFHVDPHSMARAEEQAVEGSRSLQSQGKKPSRVDGPKSSVSSKRYESFIQPPFKIEMKKGVSGLAADDLAEEERRKHYLEKMKRLEEERQLAWSMPRRSIEVLAEYGEAPSKVDPVSPQLRQSMPPGLFEEYKAICRNRLERMRMRSPRVSEDDGFSVKVNSWQKMTEPEKSDYWRSVLRTSRSSVAEKERLMSNLSQQSPEQVNPNTSSRHRSYMHFYSPTQSWRSRTHKSPDRSAGRSINKTSLNGGQHKFSGRPSFRARAISNLNSMLRRKPKKRQSFSTSSGGGAKSSLEPPTTSSSKARRSNVKKLQQRLVLIESLHKDSPMTTTMYRDDGETDDSERGDSSATETDDGTRSEIDDDQSSSAASQTEGDEDDSSEEDETTSEAPDSMSPSVKMDHVIKRNGLIEMLNLGEDRATRGDMLVRQQRHLIV